MDELIRSGTVLNPDDSEKMLSVLTKLDEEYLDSEERCVAALHAPLTEFLISKCLGSEYNTNIQLASLGCLRKLALPRANKQKLVENSQFVKRIGEFVANEESATLQFSAVAALRCLGTDAPTDVLRTIVECGVIEEIGKLAASERLLRTTQGRTLWTNMESARLMCFLLPQVQIIADRFDENYCLACCRLMRSSHLSLINQGLQSLLCMWTIGLLNDICWQQKSSEQTRKLVMDSLISAWRSPHQQQYRESVKAIAKYILDATLNELEATELKAIFDEE